MKVSDQITIAMQRKGLTDKQLADKLGVSQQTVRYWQGKSADGRTSFPNKKMLPELERALGVTIDWTEGRAAAAGAAPTAMASVDSEDFGMLVELSRLPLDSKIAFRNLLKVHVAAIDAARRTGPLAPVAPFEEAVVSEQSAARKTRGGRKGVGTEWVPVRRTG